MWLLTPEYTYIGEKETHTHRNREREGNRDERKSVNAWWHILVCSVTLETTAWLFLEVKVLYFAFE